MAVKIFNGNGTFVVPGGVRSVTLETASLRSFGNMHLGSNLFSHFIDSTGRLYATGQTSTGGMLGDGTNIDKSSPVPVAGTARFVKVQSYQGLSNDGDVVALGTDGRVYSWGDGYIGDGTTTRKSSPVLLTAAGVANCVDICAYGNSTVSAKMALNASNHLYAWGYDVGGTLGVGGGDQLTPVRVAGNLQFRSCPTPTNQGTTVCGITTSGQLYAWGDNTFGQIGDGTTVGKNSPVQVLSSQTFVQVVSHPTGFIALDSTGKAWGWGGNFQGQLGDGTTTAKSSPVPVVGNYRFVKLFNTHIGGSGTMFGLTADGKLYGWGFNGSGQIGDNTQTDKSSPVPVVGNIAFKEVWNGSQTTLGISVAGDLYAWGSPGNFLQGIPDGAGRSSPSIVPGGLKWAKIVGPSGSNVGNQHVHAMTTDGRIYGWGTNSNGELGVGDTVLKSTPTLVLGGRTGQLPQVPGNSTTLQVTPGASYSVVFGGNYIQFGPLTLQTGQCDKTLTVIYEQ